MPQSKDTNLNQIKTKSPRGHKYALTCAKQPLKYHNREREPGGVTAISSLCMPVTPGPGVGGLSQAAGFPAGAAVVSVALKKESSAEELASCCSSVIQFSFNSVYLYSAKLQQLSSQGTLNNMVQFKPIGIQLIVIIIQ